MIRTHKKLVYMVKAEACNKLVLFQFNSLLAPISRHDFVVSVLFVLLKNHLQMLVLANNLLHFLGKYKQSFVAFWEDQNCQLKKSRVRVVQTKLKGPDIINANDIMRFIVHTKLYSSGGNIANSRNEDSICKRNI